MIVPGFLDSYWTCIIDYRRWRSELRLHLIKAHRLGIGYNFITNRKPPVRELNTMAPNSESRQSRSEVPEVVINRLPQYVRILNRLLDDGIQVVSSQQLGEKLQVTPAQIRKDLSYFGLSLIHI